MRMVRWGLAAGVLLAACGGGNGGDQERPPEGAAAAVLPTGPDPCSLVSQAEMEAEIGPLAEPPYRVDGDRSPAVDGEGCFYRARDRRNVTLGVDWEDGEMAFRMLAGTGQAVTDILSGYDPSTDTLEGAWDKVGAAFGQLIALKGDVAVQIDPLGSRLGLDGAARLVSIALRRVESPLNYSGARATVARPAAAPAVRDPCTLVSRQEAEALMGPLREDPTPSADNSECAYVTRAEMLGSPITRILTVVWTDGFYSLGQERMAIAGAAKAMAAQMDPDLPDLSQNAIGEAEPWDERVTLLGGMVTVVKADALLQINGEGVDGFDEAKALAMLRIAARRLQSPTG